jgi:hypothetical protein
MTTMIVVSVLCSQALAAAPAGAIELQGVAPRAGSFGHLSFQVRVPWMQGCLEVRMPETLASGLGLHFIDHERSDMPPLSMLDPAPVWEKDIATSAVAYRAVTKEGVLFMGRATPVEDGVAMEFRVKNETGEPMLNTNCQMCLVLALSPDFGQQHDLTRTFAWIGGAFTSLASTSPTPEEKGRKPWILMPTKELAPNYSGPREWPDGWWMVDQAADHTLIARLSKDEKHLTGIAWDERSALLMTNTNIPCIHAGPNTPKLLAPGDEAVWRGKLYLLGNDPAALLAAYTRDMENWEKATSK